MSTKDLIAYTNQQVKQQLARGRGRLVVVKLDPRTREQIYGPTNKH